MGLRPACSVRDAKGMAYTRTAHRNMSKAYVRGIPGLKTHTFTVGKAGDYAIHAALVSKDRLQLRHNQLEAARVAANQYAMKHLGLEGYYLKLRIYPYHILRENALATGAGADRFQSGMARAFGKPSSTAARVKNGTRVISVWVPEGNEAVAKEALRRAKMKLSGHYSIVVEKKKK